MPGETVGRDLIIPSPPRRKVYLRIEELPDTETPANPGGRRVLLARPSAHVMRLAQRVDANEPGSAEYVTAVYDLAEALLVGEPDAPLSRADVERVPAETVFYIFALFNEPITKLEEIAKNGGAPLAEARKGSNSRTPSPTPAPASPRRSRRSTAK
jgi:hypothetical protein